MYASRSDSGAFTPFRLVSSKDVKLNVQTALDLKHNFCSIHFSLRWLFNEMRAKTSVGLHAVCSLLFSSFNEHLDIPINLVSRFYFLIIRSAVLELLRKDRRQTDVMKLIQKVSWHYNGPSRARVLWSITVLLSNPRSRWGGFLTPPLSRVTPGNDPVFLV
jgi:hypothetical protein